MDRDDLDGTAQAVAQILAPGARFLISLVHPCFPGSEAGLPSWPSDQDMGPEGFWASADHNRGRRDPDWIQLSYNFHLPEHLSVAASQDGEARRRVLWHGGVFGYLSLKDDLGYLPRGRAAEIFGPLTDQAKARSTRRSSEHRLEHEERTRPGEVPAVTRARAWSRPSSWWRAMASPAVLGTYALASWLVLLPLPLVSNTTMPNCACDDPAQQVWFVALGAAQVAHHHLSLFTKAADYPTGANLLVNTSMPLLAWAASPVTLSLGPVAAFDLLCRLALFLSAVACYFMLRRFNLGRLGAGLGGLLYGFSPYMFDQGGLHLFVMFVPLPPLMILLVYQQAKATRWPSTLRRGVLLAVLAGAQFLICSEILVTTALVVTLTLGVYGAILAAISYRHRLRTMLAPATRLAALGGVALVVAGPFLGWAAHYGLAGPQGITGPLKEFRRGVNWANVLLPVNGTELLGRLVPIYSRPVLWFENASLIGWPLLAVASLTFAYCRRDHLVAAAGCLAVLAWALSLGSFWEDHIPILQDISVNRLTLYTHLGVAVLVAIGVHRLATAGSNRLRFAHHGIRRDRWLPTAGVAGICLALATLFPWPPAEATASIGAAQLAANYLDRAPPGTTALTYPYPRYKGDQAMLWQALGGMKVSLLGGYLLRPNTHGMLETTAAPLDPDAVPALLQRAWLDEPLGPRLFNTARRQLPFLVGRYRVGVILVDTAARHRHRITASRLCRQVVRLVSDSYGRPLRVGHFDVWYPRSSRVESNRAGPPGRLARGRETRELG